VTAILAVGDTRQLKFKLCRHKKKSDGQARGPFYIDHDPITFDMKNGSLFFLHPKDEKLLERDFYHLGDHTFFKHGCDGVYCDKGGLSLGLVFRVSIHSREVYSDTGKLVLTPEEIEQGKNPPKFTVADNFLNEYLQDESRKAQDDDHRKSLWLSVREKYFKK